MGPKAIQEMEDEMKTIRQRIKEARDRQKSYVDVHLVDRSYEVGDRFFLRVKLHKSPIKFGKGAKLSLLGSWDLLRLWRERDPWPID